MPGWVLVEPHFPDGFRYYGRRGSEDELATCAGWGLLNCLNPPCWVNPVHPSWGRNEGDQIWEFYMKMIGDEFFDSGCVWGTFFFYWWGFVFTSHFWTGELGQSCFSNLFFTLQTHKRTIATHSSSSSFSSKEDRPHYHSQLYSPRAHRERADWSLVRSLKLFLPLDYGPPSARNALPRGVVDLTRRLLSLRLGPFPSGPMGFGRLVEEKTGRHWRSPVDSLDALQNNMVESFDLGKPKLLKLFTCFNCIFCLFYFCVPGFAILYFVHTWCIDVYSLYQLDRGTKVVQIFAWQRFPVMSILLPPFFFSASPCLGSAKLRCQGKWVAIEPSVTSGWWGNPGALTDAWATKA